MSEESPQGQIDETEHDADKELGEMESEAAEMDDRLEEHESGEEEVEVPEPDRGETFSMDEPDGEDAAVADESGIPEDQGEAADAAGQ